MIIRRIKSYKLDLDRTLPFFIDHIGCGKTFSEKISQKIDFSTGYFSTILPCDAHEEKIFDLSLGGIIPPTSQAKESFVNDHNEKDLPQQVITMDQECSQFVADFLKRDKQHWAIIENYTLDPESQFAKIENVKMLPFHSEVYYFLNDANSIEEIYKTIRKCGQVWHFLAVLTRLKPSIGSTLTEKVMDQICENVTYVIAGAYDGEGYVFWKSLES